jgi:ABC-2 type transport system ATP-binding protein
MRETDTADPTTRFPQVAADDFLIAQDLQKAFGPVTAVDGVSFTIRKREIFGLLGPNGAGKTTAIRMLSTVLTPDAGDVIIGGNSVRKQPDAVRRIIGVCPQELALYEELPAVDNLVFFGRMAGVNGRAVKERAHEQLVRVGLEDRAKDRVDKFSGGMKRRVNLAIALMGNPEMLFLDEPTVGIDPQSRNHIFDTILDLRDKGLTVLYTTHYMEEADRLCDRIGIIDHGQLIALGTPTELKAKVGDPAKVTLEEVFLQQTGRSLRD